MSNKPIDKPFVSICISTWNRCDDLRALLKSIMRQDYPNYEVCVIDNASLDGTFKVLREYEKYFAMDEKLLRYRLLPAPNPNAIQTINQSLQMGCEEFVLIMDDDARFEARDGLSRLVKIMIEKPDAAIVGAHVVGEDGLSQLMINDMNGNSKSDQEMTGITRYYNFHGACALFRRDALIRLGYYDESFVIYMNELDLALKAISFGYNVYLDLDAIVVHKGTVNMNACNKKAIYAIRNYNRVIRRNFTGLFKYKALILQTIMTFGFFAERILLWKDYKKRCLIPLIYRTILYNFTDIFRLQPKNIFHRDFYLYEIRESIYNSMKQSIMDRIKWTIFHKSGRRGFK